MKYGMIIKIIDAINGCGGGGEYQEGYQEAVNHFVYDVPPRVDIPYVGTDCGLVKNIRSIEIKINTR